MVIPEAEPLAPQLIKFEKKVAAGAQFFITPPVFDLEKFRHFRQMLPPHPVKLLASVKVLSAEEVAQAAVGPVAPRSIPCPPDVVQELSGLEAEEILAKAAEAGRALPQTDQGGKPGGRRLSQGQGAERPVGPGPGGRGGLRKGEKGKRLKGEKWVKPTFLILVAFPPNFRLRATEQLAKQNWLTNPYE